MSEEIMTSAADLTTMTGLRAENDALRLRMTQAERARDAERAARRNAEADAATLTTALIDWIDADGTLSFADTDDALAKLARSLRTSTHPGAGLLRELEAARKVVEAARSHDWGNVGDALYIYDEATKERL